MHNNKFFSHFMHFLQKIGAILPAIFWLMMLYAFDEPLAATLTLLAAIIHEAGHQIYIYLVLGRPGNMRSTLCGFRISKGSILSYKTEALIYFSGPLANILCAVILIPILLFVSENAEAYLQLFIIINLATAASNLLPIERYDGYGILECIFAYYGIREAAMSILSFISLLLSSFICILALYIMARIGDGYWIFGIFIFSLISGISKSLGNKFQVFRSKTE